MEKLVLIGTAVGVVIAIWWFFAVSRRGSKRPESFALLPEVSIASAPLLTEVELSLYNLIQMAVQDRYLVFAQVPLWSFVSVQATGNAQTNVLKHMALKRVNYVLVHPGSRQVEQVVQIEDVLSDHYGQERQRVIESVLDAAGIQLVMVQSTKSYTIPDLAALFGLVAEDA